MGPTLSLRGADNRAYYKLSPEDSRYDMDDTGCGNSLNMQHPRVLQLIMDSLRYWVGEMHVDGFRFDLASTLARELYEVNRLGAFFDIIHLERVRKFFLGRDIRGEGIQDSCWFKPSGEEMSEDVWQAGFVRCLGVRLAGDLIGDADERGEPIVGDTIMLLQSQHARQCRV